MKSYWIKIRDDGKPTENQVELTVPWRNEFLNPPRTEYSYGVRLGGNTSGSNVMQNQFKSMNGAKALKDGYYGFGVGTSTDVKVQFDPSRNVFDGLTDKDPPHPPVYLP